MKATFRKHVLLSPVTQKEILIVHLSGNIDSESVDLFRQACRGPLAGRPVLFNLEHLSFVGSSGLRPFLESLNDLTKTAGSDVRFCEVRNDFRQILSATPLGRRPCLVNEASGVESYKVEFVQAADHLPAPSVALDFADDLSLDSAADAIHQPLEIQDGDLSADG